MAVERGKQINITDYRQTYSESWRQDGKVVFYHGTRDDNTHTSATYYVNAPSFVAKYEIEKSFTASISLYITFYKWDGQNSFISYGGEHSLSVDSSIFEPASKSAKFVHNKDNESYDYHDNSDTHLWKIYIRIVANGGTIWSPGKANGKLTLWTGGIEVVPHTSSYLSTYEHMWKTGSLIYASSGSYYTTSDYGSDTAFINAQKPGAYRGTPISVGTAKYAYSIKET